MGQQFSFGLLFLTQCYRNVRFVQIVFQGDRMLSPHSISFHYVDPAHMYMYEFLLYELKRYGTT